MNGSSIRTINITEISEVSNLTVRSKRISRNSGIVVIPLFKYLGKKRTAMATIESDDHTSQVISNIQTPSCEEIAVGRILTVVVCLPPRNDGPKDREQQEGNERKHQAFRNDCDTGGNPILIDLVFQCYRTLVRAVNAGTAYQRRRLASD